MNKSVIFIFIVALIIVGAGSFYGGLKYGQGSVRDTSTNQRGQMVGQFRGAGDGTGVRRNGGLPGGEFINGEVISRDDKSLTVKLRDGGSKIVFFSASINLSKTVEGVISDLAVGQTVTISGSSNSDGSLTATAIQIRPEVSKPALQP